MIFSKFFLINDKSFSLFSLTISKFFISFFNLIPSYSCPSLIKWRYVYPQIHIHTCWIWWRDWNLKSSEISKFKRLLPRFEIKDYPIIFKGSLPRFLITLKWLGFSKSSRVSRFLRSLKMAHDIRFINAKRELQQIFIKIHNNFY